METVEFVEFVELVYFVETVEIVGLVGFVEIVETVELVRLIELVAGKAAQMIVDRTFGGKVVDPVVGIVAHPALETFAELDAEKIVAVAPQIPPAEPNNLRSTLTEDRET